MAKLQSMAGADNIISGNPSEYFTQVSGEGLVNPIIAPMPTAGGTTAMRGVKVNYPNSNEAGIRNSINDGATVSGGVNGKKVTAGAPMRNPVNGTNPAKPVQRKGKR
jgi:hypothetical protein